MFLRYLKTVPWTFILCCVMAFCLLRMALQGFNIPAEQVSNVPVQLVIVLVLTALLTVISYNRKTITIGIIAFVAAAAAGAVTLWQTGNLALAFTDTEENRFQFYLLCIAFSIGVYLLALTRRGIYVLLILGIIICAMVHYLYYIDQIIYLILFLIGALSILVLKTYQQSVMQAKTMKLAFAGTFLMAIVCCVTVILISIGLYFAFIAPRDLPVRELKLYDKEVAMRIVKQTGVTSTVRIPSPSLRRQMEEEQGDDKTEDTGDSGSKGAGGAAGVDEDKPGDVRNGHTFQDLMEKNAVLNPIRHPLPGPAVLKILSILAAIIAALILVKRWYRSQWLKKIGKHPENQQISMIYHFYLKKMRQLKLSRRSDETPYEYLERQGKRLSSFDNSAGSAVWLTDLFVRTSYAGKTAAPEECEQSKAFYRQLFGRFRNYLGNFRYIFLLYYFRL